jgi:hypothetical protein
VERSPAELFSNPRERILIKVPVRLLMIQKNKPGKSPVRKDSV